MVVSISTQSLVHTLALTHSFRCINVRWMPFFVARPLGYFHLSFFSYNTLLNSVEVFMVEISVNAIAV